ncbi:threonine aldolase family protein [Variovorax sp. UC122_21]|uniref:threonine aldolase family protein n=1 Tax=Variovorax sp. UC122_21 TaxID=3374554 RepID=UPI003758353D
MHDFRSDLMSGAPEGVDGFVLEALKAAPAFGHREDPFQVRLERQIAEMLGFEDSLLVPTCTIANQIALRVWSERGHPRVVSDAHCHLVVAEAASTQILNDVKLETLSGERGHLSAQQVDQHLNAAEGVPLIWLENTHMAHGGTVMPAGWLAEISKVAGARQAPIHIDGSRIWNAIVKSGVASDQIALGADSLSLSLTKALGAPAGSMILGSREFVRRAVEIRSAFGASWRPIGVVSAAALQVLSGFERRLEQDHRRTQGLASLLTSAFAASASSFAINAPDTNILLLQTPDTAEADALHQFLMERQLMSLRFGASAIRFVVHARTDDGSIAALAASVAEFISSKSKVKA